MGSDKRNSVIDIYKGIGIMLMLMGHVGFGDVSSHIAHAFHMPMFFFISGFLFREEKDRNINKWIQQKSKSLLYPYFVFGILNYIVYVFLCLFRNDTISLSPIGHLFWVNTTGMVSGSLWFFTAFLVSNILFCTINHTLKKVWMRHVVILVISFLGIFAASYLPFRLPYALDAGMVGTGMQYVGYLLRKEMNHKNIRRIFNLSIVETIVACVIFAILILINGEINMRNGLYHNVLLFWINAVAGSVLIYNIAKHLDKWRESKTFLVEKGVKIVEGMGMNSLIYVCTNDIIVSETKHFLRLIFAGEGKINTILVHIATLIITIGIIDVITHYLPISVWFSRLKRTSNAKGEK